MQRLDLLRQEARGRTGELTEKGAKQSRALMRQLVERLPDAFVPKGYYSARSVVDNRCIMTMQEAMVQLSAMRQQLQQELRASVRELRFMDPEDKLLTDRRTDSLTQIRFDRFTALNTNAARLMTSLFSDQNYVISNIDATELSRQLFRLAGSIQHTELAGKVTLFDIFTPEEIHRHWRNQNAWNYINYGGCTLNGDSQTGDIPGKIRLMPDDIVYMTDVLGIKTDLDLRTTGETGGLVVSPLGKGVNYIHRSSQSYKWLFTDKDGGKAMADNFRVFCDKANYPIYFHCSGGADRTGSLAWVLNAVLGVSRHETETDWEVTFYPDMPDANPGDWRGEHHFDEGFGKYGDADTPWNERIVLYLKSLGITEKEIETVRAILLEPATTP
jgi:hypothetical protein